MSSTNRGGERRPSDLYETPAWCVKAMLESGIDLPGGHWLEPGAGSGNIIRAVSERRDVIFTAVELNEEHRRPLLETDAGVLIGSFLSLGPPGERFDVAIGNPPYSLAQEFIEHALDMADQVVFLLRLPFLESAARRKFFADYGVPDIWVLGNRPSFTGGGNDSTAYAWMHWRRDGKHEGKTRIIYRGE